MLPPLLFNEADIYTVCENQKSALKKAASAQPEVPEPVSDEDVVAQLVARFDVEVPVLRDDRMTFTENEVDIDVSGDPRRLFIHRSGPFYIRGTEILVHIPFSGEAEFFRIRPSTFSLSPPRGVVRKGELLLRFQYPNDSPPPNLRNELDSQIQQIKGYLESLRQSAQRLEAELLAVATGAWQQRKSQFTSKTQVISALGLPRREELRREASPYPTALPRSTNRTSKTEPIQVARVPKLDDAATMWHIFISHASEDKTAIAKPLADALIAAGFQVWYDDYTLNVGDSLRQKIDEGLAKSDFGIVILSKSFFAKHWPQQELNGLASRESNYKKVILPVWHDISRDEVTAMSPMLADRLGVPTSMGLDHVVTRLMQAMK